MDKKTTNLIDVIKSNWLLLVFIFAMVVWYANTNFMIKKAQADIQNNANKIEILQKMQIDIATMKVDISYIKENINK